MQGRPDCPAGAFRHQLRKGFVSKRQIKLQINEEEKRVSGVGSDPFSPDNGPEITRKGFR